MEMTVLFLSQQRLLRDSLERLFEDAPGVALMPPVSSVMEAVEAMPLKKPDVILIDLNPSLFALRAVKTLRDACPDCCIVALSSHDDPVAQAQLAAAGVQGFLTKDIGIGELAAALCATGTGQKVFSGASARKTSSLFEEARRLTAREGQVFELIAQGYANKQVAAALGISIKTVEKHRQSVMEKLHAHETAGLTWRAFCLGIAGAA